MRAVSPTVSVGECIISLFLIFQHWETIKLEIINKTLYSYIKIKTQVIEFTKKTHFMRLLEYMLRQLLLCNG